MDNNEINNEIISTIKAKSYAAKLGVCDFKMDYADTFGKDIFVSHIMEASPSEASLVALVYSVISACNDLNKKLILKLQNRYSDSIHWEKYSVNTKSILLLRNYLLDHPDTKALVSYDICSKYRDEFPKDLSFFDDNSPIMIADASLEDGTLIFVKKGSLATSFYVSPVSYGLSDQIPGYTLIKADIGAKYIYMILRRIGMIGINKKEKIIER